MIKGFKEPNFIYELKRQNVAATKMWGSYPLRKTEKRWKLVLKRVRDILTDLK